MGKLDAFLSQWSLTEVVFAFLVFLSSIIATFVFFLVFLEHPRGTPEGKIFDETFGFGSSQGKEKILYRYSVHTLLYGPCQTRSKK